MADAFQDGLKIYREVYGDAEADGLQAMARSGEGFGPKQAEWALEWAFGSVWTREEQLSRKLRSCVVLGMLIAQRSSGEIKYHTKMGTANGLSREELEEVFYTALPYCGFPAANTAKAAMLAAFAELDAADANTGRE